jgi:hypothetical protein
MTFSGRFPHAPGTAKCTMRPGPDARSGGTLQSATFTMKQNIDNYRDTFYLVVFAQRRWAGEEIIRQRYAVAVELEHQGEARLYQPLSQCIRVRE